jgi:hypothetical protein
MIGIDAGFLPLQVEGNDCMDTGGRATPGAVAEDGDGDGFSFVQKKDTPASPCRERSYGVVVIEG